MRDEVGKTIMEVSKKEIRKVLSISEYGPILEFPKKRTKTKKTKRLEYLKLGPDQSKILLR